LGKRFEKEREEKCGKGKLKELGIQLKKLLKKGKLSEKFPGEKIRVIWNIGSKELIRR